MDGSANELPATRRRPERRAGSRSHSQATASPCSTCPLDGAATDESIKLPNLLICDLATETGFDGWNELLGVSLETTLPCTARHELLQREKLERLPDLIRAEAPSLILLIFPADESDQAGAAVSLIQKIPAATPPIVAITDLDSDGALGDLFTLGLADYLIPPLRAADVMCRVRRWVRTSPETSETATALKRQSGLDRLIGRSPKWLAQLTRIPRYAEADACVLIQGATGTGKELCARAVHHLSRRAGGPFVPLNAGALPVDLIENELFGHESGAYTSAQTAHRGLIAEAEGGTLFLDEIDSLPLPAQVKLLRFLQEREYRPLGGKRNIAADVRFIAAGNLDLAQAVATGRFRRDLFYRINVLPLTLPSLADRREDIPLLAQHFIRKHSDNHGRGQLGFAPDALARLQSHDWPGNVRELENVIERALVLCDDWLIRAHDIDIAGVDRLAEHAGPPPPENFKSAKARVVNEFERCYLREILDRHAGNITRAARDAGKDRRAFFELLRKHRIRVSPTRTSGTDTDYLAANRLGE